MDPNTVTLVTTWPQAVAFIALVVAVMVVPSVLAYLAARDAKVNTSRALDAAQAVHTSMTQNNGGSSVKDALDRIEAKQEEHSKGLSGLGERMTAVEDLITRPQR